MNTLEKYEKSQLKNLASDKSYPEFNAILPQSNKEEKRIKKIYIYIYIQYINIYIYIYNI